jgi:hypothetical protein
VRLAIKSMFVKDDWIEVEESIQTPTQADIE